MNEADLQAWIDNEMDEAATQAFETGLLENGDDRQVAGEHLALDRALKTHLAPRTDEHRLLQSVRSELAAASIEAVRRNVIADLAPRPTALPAPVPSHRAPGAPAMLVLRLPSPTGPGRLIRLAQDRLVIGAGGSCDIVLDHKEWGISRKHAEIHLSGGRVTIADLGSTNGTRVNGHRITEPTPLAPGDRIGIGKVDLIACDADLLGCLRLFGVEGPLAGREFLIADQKLTLGRHSACSIPLQDQAASGEHAAVWLEDGRVMVQDLGSSNGTLLHGRKVETPTALRSGDLLRLGHNVLAFVDGRLEDLDGAVVNDLTLIKRVGAGSAGVTWQARARATDALVAVKLLDPGRCGDPTVRARLLNAMRAATRIEHENILPIHGDGLHQGIVYAVMTWAANGSLADLAAGGPVPPAMAASLIADAATGLAAGEQLGLVHSGLTAGDILIGEDGAGRVADFGLTLPALRPAGSTVLAVAQFELGSALHLALAGGDVDGQPLDRLAGQDGMPPLLITTVRRMTAPDPERRYQSWQELIDDLHTAALRPAGGKAPARSGGSPARRPAPTAAAAPVSSTKTDDPPTLRVAASDSSSVAAPARRQPKPGGIVFLVVAVIVLGVLLIAAPVVVKKIKAAQRRAQEFTTAPAAPVTPESSSGLAVEKRHRPDLERPPAAPPSPPAETTPPAETPTVVAATPPTETPPAAAVTPPVETPPAAPPAEAPVAAVVQPPPDEVPAVAVTQPPPTPPAAPPAPVVERKIASADLDRLLALARPGTWEDATVQLTTDGATRDVTLQRRDDGWAVKSGGSEQVVQATQIADFSWMASRDIYAKSGDNALRAKRFDDAIKEYTKALEKSPGHPWLVLQVQKATADRDRSATAATALAKAIDDRAWAGVLENLATWIEVMEASRLDKAWASALKEAYARQAHGMDEATRAVWLKRGEQVRVPLSFDPQAPALLAEAVQAAAGGAPPAETYPKFQKAMTAYAPMDDEAWWQFAKVCAGLKKNDEAARALLSLSPARAGAADARELGVAVGMSPPLLKPKLLCQTYVGGKGDQAISEVGFSKNGIPYAKGNGFQFTYDPATGKPSVGGDIHQGLAEAPSYKPGLAPKSVDVPATGESLTISYKQVHGILQQPFLTSTAGWKFWGWGKAEAEQRQLMADSRGYDIWLYPDGRHVGVLCWCDGGNSVLGRHPQNLDDNIEKSAIFSGYSNVIGGMATMLMKIDVVERKPVAGTFLASHVFFHTTDRWGRLYIPKQVGRRHASSTLIDAFHLGEGIKEAGLFVLDTDLKTNLFHAPLGGPGATRQSIGLIAIQDNLAILGGFTDAPSMPVVNGTQEKPGEGLDALITVIQLWDKTGG